MNFFLAILSILTAVPAMAAPPEAKWTRVWPTDAAQGQLSVANVLAAHPEQPDTLLLGTRPGGIFKSIDHGQTWRHTSEEFRCSLGVGPNGASLKIAPANPAVVYLGLEKLGAWRSDDGGESWQKLNKTLPRGRARNGVSVAVHPQDTETAWFGTDGGIFKTGDGGRKWLRLTDGLPTGKAKGSQDVHQTVSNILVHPERPDEVVIGIYATGHAEAAGIFRSVDGGATWKHIAFDEATSTASTNTLGLRDEMVMALAADGECIVAGTLGAGVWMSQDFGRTWQHIPGSKNAGGVAFSGTSVFAGGGGEVRRRDRNGGEWTDITGNLRPPAGADDGKPPMKVKLKLPDGTVVEGTGRPSNARNDIHSLHALPSFPETVLALTGTGLHRHRVSPDPSRDAP